MKINLQNAGKRFNREWIFRRLNYEFISGRSYAITGINGSGKSTLLQVIAGAVMHTEGKIFWELPGGGPQEDAFRDIALAAPYLEVPEEMTATELLDFQRSFKPFTLSAAEMLAAVGLAGAAKKQVRYYSSGMKQRLKLAQAFFSDTSALFLDEPLTNLDEDGISIYKNLWEHHTADRLVIVSSNDKQEYERCEEIIAMSDYK